MPKSLGEADWCLIDRNIERSRDHFLEGNSKDKVAFEIYGVSRLHKKGSTCGIATMAVGKSPIDGFGVPWISTKRPWNPGHPEIKTQS
jgi:hypothetical protein